MTFIDSKSWQPRIHKDVRNKVEKNLPKIESIAKIRKLVI